MQLKFQLLRNTSPWATNCQITSFSEQLRSMVIYSCIMLGDAIHSPLLAKQGISKRFLSYFHTLDASLGARTLGPEKTLSQKLQETVKTATEQAKSVDEQKHLTQTATDVRILRARISQVLTLLSITPKRSPRLWDRKFIHSTPPPPNKSWIYTRRPVVLLIIKQPRSLARSPRQRGLQSELTHKGKYEVLEFFDWTHPCTVHTNV